MNDYYSVKYKLPGQFFFRTVKNVTGDGIVTQIRSEGELITLPEPYRFLSVEGGALLHIPYSAIVIFGPERERIILKNMSRQAGQPVQ